jgi:hypothetical protein
VQAVTVSDALAVVTPILAEIVTTAVDPTPKVVTPKAPVVAPAATVTFAGVEAADVLELDSRTTIPPEGAGPESVTVPVDGAPPATVAGSREAEIGTGDETVNGPVAVTPPLVAVTTALVVNARGSVAVENVAVLALADTVTLAGTVATEVLEL